MVEDDAPGGDAAKSKEDARRAQAVELVPSPGAVVLHVRWKSPAATIASAASYASLPGGWVNSNLKTLVREVLDETIGDLVNTEKMAEAVNLDAPIDVVGVADTKHSRQVPEPMMAWAMGLNSVQQALKASRGKPRQLGDGVWRIGTESRWGTPCAVVAAAGAAPARLVCTESERHLEKLAPFMARNVAAMPSTASDFRVEVRLRPLLDKYGRQWGSQARGLPVIAEELKLGIPAFDAALLDAADALADEAGALLNDADALIVDGSLKRQAGIRLGVELTFAGRQSWTVQTMLDGASLAGPAPDIFWHAPRTAASVSWGRGGDPARWDPVLKTVRALLEGVMTKEKVGSAADRKAISKLFRFPVGKHVAGVGASGHFPAGGSSSTNMFMGILDATIGWHIVGIDEGPTALRSYLNEAVRTYNRPTLQRLMKKEMGGDAKHLPRVRVVPAPRSLGPGALEVEIMIPKLEDPGPLLPPPPGGSPSPSKAKTLDLKFHILLMADSGRTWVGIGLNRDPLAKLMEAVKGQTPGADTIAGLPGLERFRSERHNGASVTSLEGMLGSITPGIAMLSAAGGPGTQVSNAIAGMPNKGKSPIVMVVDAKDGPKPSLRISAEVPRGTLIDIGSLVTNLLSILGQQP